MQADHAVHLGREALVVGRDQRGAALAADQVEEFGEDDVGGVLVEIAGRLVGENQRRLVGERAGDRDALLLAARQLRRAVVSRWPRPSVAEQLFGALARRFRRRAVDQLRQDDILARVEIGQQMMELIDEAEASRRSRVRPVVVELRRFLARDPDRAFEAALEQADRLQQGRLARTRRAEQRDDLARLRRRGRRRAARRSSTSPCVKLRFRPRVSRTGSLIAQHLHRIGARRLPRRDRASRGRTAPARSGRSR